MDVIGFSSRVMKYVLLLLSLIHILILKCSDISITEYPKTNKKVGIDLGIKNLIIMSDGKSIKPPNISKIESKINKYNRKLSKQKENSKNYQKTVLMLHKLYIKRTNIIEDNLHKIAMEIVKAVSYTHLCNTCI